MAEGGQKSDEALLRNLAHLNRRALDVKFDLASTDYTPQENIGIGAYGVVCAAIHNKTNDRVAIKKIPNVFEILNVAKRTFREIKILKHFKHDNIINIREMLKPKESLADFRDVYVVFDLMESDLHKIIYSKQELSEEHVRYFLYQLLRGLKYVHSANVIHRDLKPSNLLVNEDCQLRIGDFGMARGATSSPEKPNYFMTQYVATRWYRAPEIMLSLVEYGAAVDMWSVGCIFAEMLGRKHLFPGKDYISQIKLIVGILGSPKDDLLQLCHSPIIKNYIQEMGYKEAVPWAKLYPKASRKSIHLLSQLLVLNPNDRLSVEKALVHPYLNKYHDPAEEPICVPVFNFDFEKEDFNIQQLREMIHNEAMAYHQPQTLKFSFNAFLRPVPKTTDQEQSPRQFQSSNAQGTSLLPSDVKSEVTSINSTQEAGSQHLADQESTQHAPLIHPRDTDMPKRPLSAKNEGHEVKIDTNVLKVDSADVEMLSAKAIGKQSFVTARQEPQPKENREPTKEDNNNKTISEGTKNMIKAALLNASLKKRNDSQSDDSKLKPTTAAMRQKEREDKRRHKKEKGVERRKKNKLKKVAESGALLSDADKELLQRWAKMQKVNVHIAPKPAIEVNSNVIFTGKNVAIGSTITGSAQTIAMNAGTAVSDTVFERVQSTKPERDSVNVDPVTVTTVGKVNSQGESMMTGTFKQTNIHEGTRALLQQHLRTQVGSSPGVEVEKRNKCESNDKSIASQIAVPSNQHQSRTDSECSYQNFPSCSQANNTIAVTSSPDEYSIDFSGVNLGDLDFLNLVSSPEALPNDSSSAVVGGLGTNPIYGHASSTCAADGVPEFTISGSDPLPPDLRNPAAFQSYQNLPYQQMGPRYPTHSQQQTHIAADVIPNTQSHLYPQSFQEYQQPNETSPTRLFPTSPTSSQHSVSPQFNNSPENTNRVSPNLQIPHISPISQQGGFVHHLQGKQLPFHNNNNDPVFSNIVHPIRPSNGSMLHYHATGIQNPTTITSSSSPSLLINTQQTQMAFQQIFHNPGSGTAINVTNQDNENSLISLLTKQLSKSNVDDACPPLALTPRGAGGGYGVGVDLDSLMMVSHDLEGHTAEPSPLSSSILADWMEVTGHMNIDLDALEQELSSPMALSYNDFNMYSS